jgi:hypothetical protein
VARARGGGHAVLTSLRGLLGRWAPGPRGGRGPRERALGDLLALWPSIVGEDVAQHAKPLERSGDTLVVLTTSSAWSNQLSLLTGRIICALNDAGIDGIERLRFRIARPGRAAPKRASPTGNGKATPPAGDESLEEAVPAPSATLGEALSRLRERIDRRRDAKHAQGWNPCSTCGAMLPEGSRCAPCTTAELSVRSARVQRLMFDVPWLGFQGISELVEGLSRDEYESNRAALLARWWETLERVRKTGKVSANHRERQIASSYLLLLTGWEPDRITPVIARNNLGDEIYDLLFERHHHP